MEWLLLSAALNFQMVYMDETTCRVALENIRSMDDKAVCIPNGVDKRDQFFENFFDMIDYFEQKEVDKEVN